MLMNHVNTIGIDSFSVSLVVGKSVVSRFVHQHRPAMRYQCPASKPWHWQRQTWRMLAQHLGILGECSKRRRIAAALRLSS